MKKILFAIPILSMALASCDPQTDGGDATAVIDATSLTNNLKISAKSEGNNNLTVYTDPSLYIWVYDATTNAKLGSGTAVSVQIVPPAREVSLYVETIGNDGQRVKSSAKSINVSEFTDLPAVYDAIFDGDGHGNFNTTKWGWDTDDANGVWGNGAYQESGGPDWWKVYADGIDEQAESRNLPDDGADGWFTLSLTEGVTTSRGETGTVKVTADNVKAGWDIGTITFDGTIPLFGIQVNNGNVRQYTYQILVADGTYLHLSACQPHQTWDWGTAWFWNYKKK